MAKLSTLQLIKTHANRGNTGKLRKSLHQSDKTCAANTRGVTTLQRPLFLCTSKKTWNKETYCGSSIRKSWLFPFTVMKTLPLMKVLNLFTNLFRAAAAQSVKWSSSDRTLHKGSPFTVQQLLKLQQVLNGLFSQLKCIHNLRKQRPLTVQWVVSIQRGVWSGVVSEVSSDFKGVNWANIHT